MSIEVYDVPALSKYNVHNVKAQLDHGADLSSISAAPLNHESCRCLPQPNNSCVVPTWLLQFQTATVQLDDQHNTGQ